ncbi:MAG: MotA/TolQ/ExbB proton channel family protein [Myxococcota bacterium]
MTRDRPESRRARGPTDPGLGVTGAVAAVVTVVFYLAVLPLLGSPIGELFAERGWVPYGIAYLSFWAGVLLVEKFRRFSRQREALAFDLLPAHIGERVTPDNAARFVAHLHELPERASRGLLVQRIERALQHFQARRDAREVVSSLESQAQTDADSVDSSYTMVRVFIWAVPILGFIGTVLGIGAAVGGFSDSVGSAVDLEVMKNSIGSVTGGLSVAFDTTLLALVMSILIMFPASSLQKWEEGFLADVEDYCDEHLVRRLEDAHADGPPEERWIREAVAAELAPHHEAMRQWLDRLSQIGETLTAQVVSGWEKIDEQLRLRQDRQQERLSDWAHTAQREASEELLETQRGLLRDFRNHLTAMSAEARTLQEEGAHRIDEQLAGVERLHRRLVEEQSAAAEQQSAQRSQLALAGEQLAHTLGRVRGEVAEMRDEGAREIARLVDRMEEVARSADSLQRRVQEGTEAQTRSLKGASDGLAETLGRIDQQIARMNDAADARLRAVDDLVAALADLRREAEAARAGVAGEAAEQLTRLVEQTERVASRMAEPWERQLAKLETLHDRALRNVRDQERRRPLRDLFRKD